MHDYKKLMVWQDSIDLVEEVYHLLKKFPVEELYALQSQIRRASISIPSNIAEAAGRNHNADFARFLNISLGSCNELATQLVLAHRLKYITEAEADHITGKLTEIQKKCYKLIKSLR